MPTNRQRGPKGESRQIFREEISGWMCQHGCALHSSQQGSSSLESTCPQSSTPALLPPSQDLFSASHVSLLKGRTVLSSGPLPLSLLRSVPPQGTLHPLCRAAPHRDLRLRPSQWGIYHRL